MCDLTEGFTLCSCAAETLEDPDWFLERRDETIPQQHRRGRAMRPHYNESEQAQIDAALEALNAHTAFDFDFQAQDGDVLRLRAQPSPDKTRWLRFRFENRRWTLDRSTSLTGWRSQMVDHDHGSTQTTQT